MNLPVTGSGSTISPRPDPSEEVSFTATHENADQATFLRGRPPSFPLTRLAAVLATLRDRPPAWPSVPLSTRPDPK